MDDIQRRPRPDPYAGYGDRDAAALTQGQLIEGSIGPFYIAISRATLYLLAAVFFPLAGAALFWLRDSAPAVRIVLAFGIGMETGTLIHIFLEKIRGWPAVGARVAHAAAVALVTVVLLGLLFLP